MPEDREIRVYDFAQQREMAPHLVDSESGRTVQGYAIVFKQESRVLYDKAKRKNFVEVIEPRAVTEEFLNRQDIKLLFNHDSDMLLARSIFGSGTLRYEIDSYGVKYTAELPNTTVGNDVLELIKRGDLFGCSFAFNYDKDGCIDKVERGCNKRTIIKFASICDFSIVVDPAYWGTFVSTRAFEGQQGPESPAPFSVDEEAMMLSLL